MQRIRTCLGVLALAANLVLPTITSRGDAVLTYQQKAEQTLAAVQQHYYRPEFNLYIENVEKKPEDRAFSYLWPVSGLFSGINALAVLDRAEYTDDLFQIIDTMNKYYDRFGYPEPAYSSFIIEYGGGSKFYDDNQWLGMDFILAHRLTGDAAYLERAEQIWRFVISGWSDELGGGIFWQQDNQTTKNTCSNGPAAVLALMLYEETGNREYIDWAIRLLDWVEQLRTPQGVYYDHIMLDGTMDLRTFTYNVGTPLHSYALLYKFTGEQKYLDMARELARDAHAFFAKPDSAAGIGLYPNTPWFNAVLLRGYIALYEVDPDKDRTYIDAMAANVNYAWEHARDDKGLFIDDWSGRAGVNAAHKWLLDQAAMVEIYGLLAQVYGEPV
jgi:uncharacterized protein YyaL (SSP411 family)